MSTKIKTPAVNVRTLNPAQIISVLNVAFTQIEQNAIEIVKQAARHKEWTAMLMKDDNPLAHSFSHGSAEGMNTFINQNSHALKVLVKELSEKLDQFEALKHISR